MIIDFHTHCYPEHLAARAFSNMYGVSPEKPDADNDGTLKGLLTLMEKNGIDMAIALHVATKPKTVASVNDFAANCSSDRIISFPSVHPLDPHVIREIDRLHDLGFLGIKLHPAFQDYSIEDPVCIPMFERIGHHGMITVFHAGVSKLSRKRYCEPIMVRRMLPYFQGAPVVCAHMGGIDAYEDTLRYLVGLPNLYLDTSLSSQFVSLALGRRIVEAIGADRILFGSDCPWSRQKEELQFVYAMDITQHERNQILYQNAQRLLKLV